MQLRMVLYLLLTIFSKVLSRKLPKTIARRLKAGYLVALKSAAAKGGKKGTVQFASLSKIVVGGPFASWKGTGYYINAL